MWLITRLVTGYRGFSISSVLFLRGVVQTGLGLLFAAFLGKEDVFNVPHDIRKQLLLRGVLGATGYTLYLIAISKVPLAVCVTIFFLNPSITCFISGYMLGEGMGSIEIGAGVISFLGIVLVSDPVHAASLADTSRTAYIIGCASSLLSAFMAAATYTTLRSIAPRMHYLMSVLSLGSCLIVFGFLSGGASLQELGRNPYDTGLTALGVAIGFFGQAALSAGYQHCRAGTGALVRNLDLPFVFILSAVFLGEVPRLSSVVGASCVVGATGILAFVAFRNQQRRNAVSIK